jgi:hypothetical protein
MSMRFRSTLFFLLIVCALSEAVFAVAQDTASDSSEVQMKLPPLMSGDSYTTAFGSEARSNLLTGGLTYETAYDDNVVSGGTGKPVSDFSYSIRPTISLNQSTPRQQRSFTYSPGFTFYQPTSALNEAEQSLVARYRYHLSPHIAFSASESFQQSSSVFNQQDSLAGGPVSGVTPQAAVVAPFAEEIGDQTSGGLSYQFSRNGMIGGGGTFAQTNYPNPSQASEISNSRSSSGSAFYSQRIFRSQYFGAGYQYARSLSLPAHGQSETQTHAALPFYTIYLTPTLSISLSGGPQSVIASQSGTAKTPHSWEPAAAAGIGWQGARSSFVAGYTRSVTEVNGLLGAFNTSNASATIRRQLSRRWIAGCGAAYSIQKTAIPGLGTPISGGHSVSGSASLQRTIGERMSLEFRYNRLHQSYGGIAVISSAPDSDREVVSLSYQFTRPLGR